MIGISTDGAAPVFAQAIRAKHRSPASAWVFAMGRGGCALAQRRRKHRVCRSRARRKFWQLFTAHARHACGKRRHPQDAFQSFLAEVKGLGRATANGSVTLVGCGPGDPELLTLTRGARAVVGDVDDANSSSRQRDVDRLVERVEHHLRIGTVFIEGMSLTS